MGKVVRGGDYRERGDYHKDLSPNWSYYPLYLSKQRFIHGYFRNLSRYLRILDVGCGEGVFVEWLRQEGFKAYGVDLSYSSDLVLRADILRLPYLDQTFDVVLLLDVLEHLPLDKQPIALKEASRVLGPGGDLILSVPNLAHLSSRLKFLFRGRFVRTASSVEKHPGDRPIAEFLKLLHDSGYTIRRRVGFFLTLPILFKLIQRRPAHMFWLYQVLNLFAYPNLCFLNIIVAQKGG